MDSSLTLNLNGLLLDGLVPAAGVSMSDSRFLSGPIQAETPFCEFLPQARKSIASLRVIINKRHEKVAHDVPRRMPRAEPDNKNNRLLQLVCSSSILGTYTPQVPDIL